MLPSYLLIVGKPPKRIWSPPPAIAGQVAHYMYDSTVGATFRKGASVFLYGTKGSGVPGLFAVGICLCEDDKAVPQEKDHDAFLKLKHEIVLDRPIPREKLLSVLPDSSQLMSKIAQTSFLKPIKLADDEAERFRTIVGARK